MENDWGMVPHFTCPNCRAVDELEETPAGTWYCAACGEDDF
jgi:ribosomal protein L37AE/L43A